jgi:hypothetical protein
MSDGFVLREYSCLLFNLTLPAMAGKEWKERAFR